MCTLILLSSPLLVVGILVGTVEILLGEESSLVGKLVATPFLKLVEIRRRP